MQAGSGIQTIYVTNPPSPKSYFKAVRFKEINHNFNILEIQLKEDCPIPQAKDKIRSLLRKVMELPFLGTFTDKTTNQPKLTLDNIPALSSLMRSHPNLLS